MISGARRIGVDSSIRTMLGTNPDVHSLLGTPSLNRSKKQYDDSNSEQPADDDYTPDKVGESPEYQGDDEPEYTPDLVKSGGLAELPKKEDMFWNLKYNYQEKKDDKSGTEAKTATNYDPEHTFHIISIDNSNKIRMIQHPVEDGTVRMDNRVVDPERITVKGWVHIDDVDKINEMLNKAKGNREITNTFSIYGGLGSYEKFHLVDFTKRASTEKIDVFDYTLSMQEVLMGTSTTNKVQNPSHSSTSDRGGNGGVKQ